MKNEEDGNKKVSRRELMTGVLRGVTGSFLAVGAGVLAISAKGNNYVWQLDPYKCIACGRCATHCVLDESAVKCVHAYAMCGYCNLCTGFFDPQPRNLDTGAENQLCPAGAINRTFVEDPYYEYKIDEPLCIGCGKCVKGCTAFGNGSLFLQVKHDRCLNCNECSIAQACPSGAFKRVPVDEPYIIKSTQGPEDGNDKQMDPGHE
jgi:electron transport complex protein RnfB